MPIKFSSAASRQAGGDTSSCRQGASGGGRSWEGAAVELEACRRSPSSLHLKRNVLLLALTPSGLSGTFFRGPHGRGETFDTEFDHHRNPWKELKQESLLKTVCLLRKLFRNKCKHLSIKPISLLANRWRFLALTRRIKLISASWFRWGEIPTPEKLREDFLNFFGIVAVTHDSLPSLATAFVVLTAIAFLVRLLIVHFLNSQWFFFPFFFHLLLQLWAPAHLAIVSLEKGRGTLLRLNWTEVVGADNGPKFEDPVSDQDDWCH